MIGCAGRMGSKRPHSTAPRLRAAQPDDVAALARLLGETWPDATCELDHANAYQLLCATILAAQSTDRTINTLTPALFAKYPDARALAVAEQGELERMIFSSGFFRMKAKSLIGMARAVVERHAGEIPRTMEELCALPGVARKTANVVLGTAYGIAAGVVVDTHVTRLAYRLGLTRETDPVKIEDDLTAALPQAEWITFPNRLIWHGRRVCHARTPACDSCTLAPHCPSAFLPVVTATPVSAARRAGAARAKARASGRKAVAPAASSKPRATAAKRARATRPKRARAR
jgi:endonuclease III